MSLDLFRELKDASFSPLGLSFELKEVSSGLKDASISPSDLPNTLVDLSNSA